MPGDEAKAKPTEIEIDTFAKRDARQRAAEQEERANFAGKISTLKAVIDEHKHRHEKESKNEKKELQEAREKVLKDMEQRVENLQTELKGNSVPKDFALQIAEIKKTAETMKEKFASASPKDLAGEKRADDLINKTKRMPGMVEAIENKKMAEKKVEATVTQTAEVSASHRFNR